MFEQQAPPPDGVMVPMRSSLCPDRRQTVVAVSMGDVSLMRLLQVSEEVFQCQVRRLRGNGADVQE